MYCNICGTQNPDESVYCVNCGNELSKPKAAPVQRVQQPTRPIQPSTFQQPNRPTYQPYRPTYQPPTQEELMRRASAFRIGWRKIAASPFMLIVTILYSLMFILNAYNTFEGTNSAFGALGSLGLSGSSMRALREYSTLVEILALTPSFLMTLGLWLTFGQGCKKNDDPISKAGLNMISAVQIIGLVLYCIVGVVMFIVMLRLGNVVAFFVMLGVMIFLIVAQSKNVSMLSTMRACVDGDCTDTDHVTFVAVMQFVFSTLIFFYMYEMGMDLEDFFELPFATILSLLMPMLLGVFLLTYKAKMDQLEEEL